jgi:hypothetical protein
VIEKRHADLPKIVCALLYSRRFSRCLNGWQEQSHQNANDRNDH